MLGSARMNRFRLPAPTGNSSFTPTYCGFGCTESSCMQLGSGLCCDVRYRTTSIVPNPDCKGDQCNCGKVRVRGSYETARSSKICSEPGANTWIARSAKDDALNGASLSEDVLFIPDRCKGRYGVVYPQDSRATCWRRIE